VLLRAPPIAGHGRLTVPVTRGGTGYENDPVQFDSEAWVCRHAMKNPAITPPQVTAGTDLSLTWDFSAAHVGDCSVFLSYDVDKALAEQEYFKIANMPKCKDQNRMPMPIRMPAWLPAGDAVLRWDWYGLHQGPNSPEFYSQCADINVVAGAQPVALEGIVKYKIIGIYPAPRSDGGPHYRNAFGNGKNIGDPGFFMTGPACADAMSTDNNCAFTMDNGNGGDITGGGAGGDGGGGAVPDETEPPPCVAVTYTVVAGDTLTSIANEHPEQQVDWIQICVENDLPDCDVIDVGDELTIPCDANLQALAAGDDNSASTAMLAVGIVFVLLAAGGITAFVVYQKRPFKQKQPPPPPPPPPPPSDGPTLRSSHGHV